MDLGLASQLRTELAYQASQAVCNTRGYSANYDRLNCTAQHRYARETGFDSAERK